MDNDLIFIWCQDIERLEAFLAQGWKLVHSRRGYSWQSYLLALEDL